MPRKTHLSPPADDLIDIHCHQFSRAGHRQILSRDLHELANGTFDASGYTPSPPEILLNDTCYFSLGIHPWFIDRQNIETAFRTLESFNHHPKLLAIGECGLDKCIDTPMSVQVDVFSSQVQLSEELRKPLIIHCVRAFAELLQLKKSLTPTQPWIMHGFSGKPALTAQLIKHGCYISFGKAILQTGSQARLALQATPIDRLFLETDAADVSIDTIYAAAAKIRGVDPVNLRRQILSNFLNVFFND